MSNKLTIAISGKSGCGNTSVSRIVSRTLGLRLINYTFHDLAREKGIEFEKLCLMAEENTEYDLFLDNMLIMLSSIGTCVLGSRLAIWHLKNAHLKIYLTGSIDIRSRRIAQRENLTFEQAQQETLSRDARDRARYLHLYGIDVDHYHFADLIIDTESGDQFFVADRIIKAAMSLPAYMAGDSGKV